MKKIAMFLLVVFFITGCGSGQPRITIDVSGQTPSIIKSKKAIPIPSSKAETLDLSYNAVVNDKTNSYVGKQVTWTGRIASELSQIDGIKFWVIDADHPNSNKQLSDWFWAIQEGVPDINKYDGNWIKYMMATYSDSTSTGDVNSEYTVTGKLDPNDCEYHSGVSQRKCVPNLIVEKISRVK